MSNHEHPCPHCGEDMRGGHESENCPKHPSSLSLETLARLASDIHADYAAREPKCSLCGGEMAPYQVAPSGGSLPWYCVAADRRRSTKHVERSEVRWPIGMAADQRVVELSAAVLGLIDAAQQQQNDEGKTEKSGLRPFSTASTEAPQDASTAQSWIAALIESELGDVLAADSAGDPSVNRRGRAVAVAEYIVNRHLADHAAGAPSPESSDYA